MIQPLTNRLWDFLTLAPLTGPVFDKELRVASRRKRTYLLRTVYIAAMGILLVPILGPLLQTASWRSVSSIQVNRIAAEFCRISNLLQFYGFQAIALVLMSSSIHDEILHRTIGTLWSTPIRGYQLILGKLCGGLFPLVQLILLIVPLIVVLRAFSALPWIMIFAGFCLTLTTVLLVASCTLLVSLYIRRPYLVLIASGLILAGIYELLPLLVEVVANSFFKNSYLAHLWVTLVAQHWNPYGVVQNAWVRRFAFYPTDWWKSCVVSTAIAMILLYRASQVVRRRGLEAIEPKIRKPEFRPEVHSPKIRWLYRPLFLHTLIERIFGPGVIWREFVSPLYLGRFRMVKVVTSAVLFTLVLWVLIAVAVLGTAQVSDLSTFYWFSQFGFHAGIFLTVISACTVITREYECQSWPILMTTLLTTRQILGGKIFGVLRRTLGLWIALLLFLSMCWQQDVVSGKKFGMSVLLMAVTAWFLTSMGFFLAVWLRRMGLSLAVFAGILGAFWYAMPYLLDQMYPAIYFDLLERPYPHMVSEWLNVLFGYFILSSPPWLLNEILQVSEHYHPFGQIGLAYVLTVLFYGFAGWILFWLAGRQLRKHIFD